MNKIGAILYMILAMLFLGLMLFNIGNLTLMLEYGIASIGMQILSKLEQMDKSD